jgi:hypothetical protein
MAPVENLIVWSNLHPASIADPAEIRGPPAPPAVRRIML